MNDTIANPRTPRFRNGRIAFTRPDAVLSGLRRLAAMVVGTEDRAAQVALRLTLAIVIWPHGAQKAFGWFGGYGFEGTMGWLTGDVGVPWLLALAVILLEFLGPLALVAGFLTRPVALGLGGNMVGAILTTHLGNGFFMNWEGAQAGEGYEFHLLVLGIAVALVIAGSGRASADLRIARRLESR